MIAVKMAAIATRRRIGAQSRGGASSLGNGRSGASMVSPMETRSTTAARPSASHRFPALMKRAIVNDTRIRGRGTSRTALTAENRPRCSSGTRSGMRPCCAPWAVLAATACRTAMAKRNQKPAIPVMPAATPVRAMKTVMARDPMRMNGRRRPRCDVLRSDSMPMRACHRSATMRLHSLSSPRRAPFVASPTKFWTSRGKTSPLVCDRVVSARKKMLMVMRSYQRSGRDIGLLLVLAVLCAASALQRL